MTEDSLAPQPSDDRDGLADFASWEKHGEEVRRKLEAEKRAALSERDRIDARLSRIDSALAALPKPVTSDEDAYNALNDAEAAEHEAECAREEADQDLRRVDVPEACRAILRRFPTGLTSGDVLARVREHQPDVDKRLVYSFLSRAPEVHRVGDCGSRLYYPKTRSVMRKLRLTKGAEE